MRICVLLIYAVLTLVANVSVLQAVPANNWTNRLRSAWGYSIAIDAAGDVVVAGTASLTENLGGDPLHGPTIDVIIGKYDRRGNHLWSRRFGDDEQQFCHSVAVDRAGNFFVTGTFDGTLDFGGVPLIADGSDISDIFLAKFDGNGNHIWSKGFGDDCYDVGMSVAVDADGNVVVTGHLGCTTDFGGGAIGGTNLYDAFVAKFDGDGHHIWSRIFGDPDDAQIGYSIAVDGEGNVVVTGMFSAVIVTSPVEAAIEDDAFVARFNPLGEVLWTKSFGDDSHQAGFALTTDGLGDIIVTGRFDGAIDFGGGPLVSAGGFDLFVAKLDHDGNHVWSRRCGDAARQEGTTITARDDNSIVMSGWVQGLVNFGGDDLGGFGGKDVFLASYSNAGQHLWSRRFGDTSDQSGTSIDSGSQGEVVVAGNFAGVLDFGGGPITAEDSDAFVARFSDNEVAVLITSFEARISHNAVEIVWDVWSDEALESFSLLRREDGQRIETTIAGGAFGPTTRSYVDDSVEVGKTYHYGLVIHTRAGEDFRSRSATVTVPRLQTTLVGCFPNPFSAKTSIEYTLGEGRRAVVGIYSVNGELVARLDQGVVAAGVHRVEWDGRNANGNAVGSGVYFYRIEGVATVEAKKLVIVR